MTEMKLSLVAAALVLAGCVSVPAIDPASLPAAPQAYKTAPAAAPGIVVADGAWWRAFNDPQLDGLVQRAQVGNNSIQVAAARLAQARALVRTADAQRLPQVGIGGGASRGADITTGGRPATVGSAGANVSYEIDLFGRLAEASRAASLDAKARESLLASTRLLVQAEVAQAYLLLRAVDTERALVRETVTAYRASLNLVERRHSAGDVAELDVARVRTEVAATEAEAIALDRRRAELVNAIAVLLGEAPSTFTLADRDWDTRLPVIPAGLPSAVLERRPDVASANASMLAAQARVGVAKAAWFPTFSLTGEGGFASTDLSDVFKWSSRAWGVGALLSLPVFDGGRRNAEIERSRAELDAALAQYREQVLVAFREVEDHLSGLQLLARQAEAQASAVESARRATALSESRYRNGYVSQLELLDAQRSELRNRRAALQVRSAQAQTTVALVRALGGGW
jgi:multidrug efflux system outer membrane protein